MELPRQRTIGVAVAALSTITLASVIVPSLGAAHAVSGSVSSYVPITPCRLIDTRPKTAEDLRRGVGPRVSPLHEQETAQFAVRGPHGSCDIPADAIGITANVTIDRPTDQSYLTVWPADAAQPTASNLNWVAGDPPTPNFVSTALSADGAIKLFNNAGDVDVIIDIVGYHVAAASSVAGPPGPAGPQGERGPAGSVGDVRTTSAVVPITSGPAGIGTELVAVCPDGAVAVGGGHQLTSNGGSFDQPPSLEVLASMPALVNAASPEGRPVGAGEHANAWKVVAENSGDVAPGVGEITAWAQCAS